LQERVVRAPEHEDVDVHFPQRPEILLRDQGRRGVVDPALLDERDEERARLGVDAGPREQPSHGPVVRSRGDGAHRPDHADSPGPCRGDGRAGAGLDHPDHRDRSFLPQEIDGVRSGGVARHDDQLDVAGEEEGDGFARVALHRLAGLRPVRHPRGVAEVHDRLVRKLPPQLPNDGQPTDPGVEDADGPFGGRAQGFPPAGSVSPTVRRPSGRGSTTTRPGKSARWALTRASTPLIRVTKIVIAIQSSRCSSRAWTSPRISVTRSSLSAARCTSSSSARGSWYRSASRGSSAASARSESRTIPTLRSSMLRASLSFPIVLRSMNQLPDCSAKNTPPRTYAP